MRRLTEINNTAKKYRGEILNEIAWLEKLIDTYIANHFTSNNQALTVEMQLLVFGDNRIAFENKRQIFHYLAELHDNEWYKSYKSVRHIDKKSIEMNKDLVYVIEERNVFAHCLVDTSKEALNQSEHISFLRFKNDVSRFDYSPERFSELRLIIMDLIATFQNRIK